MVASAHDIEVVNPEGKTIYYVWINDHTELSVASRGEGAQGEQYEGDIIIPETVVYEDVTYNVTGIEPLALRFCDGITSVVVPKSIKTIGGAAFGNRGLESITIHSDEFMQNGDIRSAFEGSYCHIIFGDEVTSIPDWAFGNIYITGVTFGKGMKSIGAHAFWGCQGLTSVTIPDNVTELKTCAFYSCYHIESVEVGNGVSVIEPQTFAYCIALTSVTLGNSVEEIGKDAFYKCNKLTAIDLPPSVKRIGSTAFLGCEKMEYCTGGSGLTSIADHAFYECRSLKSFVIPEGVTAIEDETFNECTSMESIQIPGSVTRIGACAFVHCRSLKSLFIPRSVTSIGGMAFGECLSLESIQVEEGNPVYDSRENCNAIIREVTNITTFLEVGCQNTTIPSSVTYIGASAFWAQRKLTSIEIPSTVKYIQSDAFEYCDNLTSLTLPSTHVSLSGYAFYYGGDDTAPVTIRNQRREPTDIEQDVFSPYLYEHATLVVPNGTVDKYKACEGWKNFANIIEERQTAVQTVVTDTPSVQERYTLDGKRSATPQRGLNILRMSDGSARKVLAQ